jgi:hypothetical protein
MLKDENPTFLNIVAFVLFIMIFGCIYAIWTNFIPNAKWKIVSIIFGLIFAAFYSTISLLIKTDNLNIYKKSCICILVFVSCYFIFFYNISYSLPSIITELSAHEFNEQYEVLEKRERKLPLFSDPDCPYSIRISEYKKDTNKNKVCLSYAEVSRINLNDVISIQGKESWFGKKIKIIK